MNDLKARIAACQEMRPTHYANWLRSFPGCTKCVEYYLEWYGCDEHCQVAWSEGYAWHGGEGELPSPESLHVGGVAVGVRGCPECGTVWMFLARHVVHSPFTLDFDEATERARLIPQPEMERSK